MISFVIPLRDEVDSLATLHAELASITDAASLGSVEFVFVDDGSRDGSWDVVERLAAADPRVIGVRLRRNFGKAAALTAGFRLARGETVFTLDGDLQDDPAEIPRFLAKLDEGTGLDLVSGWKRKRHDPWHKVGPSRVFNRIVGSVTGLRLHDHNCGYKAYRREVLGEVAIYGELHRYVPALAHAQGFRVGEIEVHHRARQHGASKYGASRFLKGLIDLGTVHFLTRYGRRPNHPLGAAGLGLLGLGAAGWGLVALLTLTGRIHGTGLILAAVAASSSVVAGIQCLVMGLVAELVNARRIDLDATYSIAATVGVDPIRRPPTLT